MHYLRALEDGPLGAWLLLLKIGLFVLKSMSQSISTISNEFSIITNMLQTLRHFGVDNIILHNQRWNRNNFPQKIQITDPNHLHCILPSKDHDMLAVSWVIDSNHHSKTFGGPQFIYILFVKSMNHISDEGRSNFLHVAPIQLQKQRIKMYTLQNKE